MVAGAAMQKRLEIATPPDIVDDDEAGAVVEWLRECRFRGAGRFDRGIERSDTRSHRA